MNIGSIIIMGMFTIVLVAFLIVVAKAWWWCHQQDLNHKAQEKEDLRRRIMDEEKATRRRLMDEDQESERIMTEGWMDAVLEDAEYRCRR